MHIAPPLPASKFLPGLFPYFSEPTYLWPVVLLNWYQVFSILKTWKMRNRAFLHQILVLILILLDFFNDQKIEDSRGFTCDHKEVRWMQVTRVLVCSITVLYE